MDQMPFQMQQQKHKVEIPIERVFRPVSGRRRVRPCVIGQRNALARILDLVIQQVIVDLKLHIVLEIHPIPVFLQVRMKPERQHHLMRTVLVLRMHHDIAIPHRAQRRRRIMLRHMQPLYRVKRDAPHGQRRRNRFKQGDPVVVIKQLGRMAALEFLLQRLRQKRGALPIQNAVDLMDSGKPLERRPIHVRARLGLPPVQVIRQDLQKESLLCCHR